MSVDPITPGAYFAPCKPDPLPVFQFTAARNSGLGNIFDVRARLLTNGEYLPMSGPSSLSSAGTSSYRYNGDIPYDGHARYRFDIQYRVGWGIFSTRARGKRPNDRYYHRPVGQLVWSASAGHESTPLPDTFVNVSQRADERPERFIILGEVLTPGVSGPQSDTARVTLTNNYSYPVVIDLPTISVRADGSPVPPLTIAPATPTTFPVTVPAGGTLDFDVTYSVVMDGTTSVSSPAGIEVPYTDTIRSCTLGPIWIDADYSYSAP